MESNKDSIASRSPQSNASIARNAWIGLVFLVALLAAIIFIAAGTVYYLEGWLFWLSFTGWVVVITAYFLKHDPTLVASRTKVGPSAEVRGPQKLYQGVASVAFVALMLVPALAFRFGWSHVPVWGVALGLILVNVGFAIVAWVMLVNTYAASTIQVVDGQKVISTGPYAYVRHPMYAGALLLIYGISPALGSWLGLLAAFVLTASIAVRLLDEERVLNDELPGYAGYAETTRHRLVPGIW